MTEPRYISILIRLTPWERLLQRISHIGHAFTDYLPQTKVRWKQVSPGDPEWERANWDEEFVYKHPTGYDFRE